MDTYNHIDYITVNGSTRQAEDQTYNTGVYQDGECGGGSTTTNGGWWWSSATTSGGSTTTSGWWWGG